MYLYSQHLSYLRSCFIAYKYSNRLHSKLSSLYHYYYMSSFSSFLFTCLYLWQCLFPYIWSYFFEIAPASVPNFLYFLSLTIMYSFPIFHYHREKV